MEAIELTMTGLLNHWQMRNLALDKKKWSIRFGLNWTQLIADKQLEKQLLTIFSSIRREQSWY